MQEAKQQDFSWRGGKALKAALTLFKQQSNFLFVFLSSFNEY